jgi:hypothetical protein
VKEINKIIEVSAACCVQLGLGTLLIPKLLMISVTAARCYNKYISPIQNYFEKVLYENLTV